MFVMLEFSQRKIKALRGAWKGQNGKSAKGPSRKEKSPSNPKSKAHKQKISAEKAQSQESDRMSALILASIGEDDDDTLWINISKIFIQAKSKARKREISPSTDEEDYYTPSRSSLGKSPFKSKAHK